jgi:hypothetical protein
MLDNLNKNINNVASDGYISSMRFLLRETAHLWWKPILLMEYLLIVDP